MPVTRSRLCFIMQGFDPPPAPFLDGATSEPVNIDRVFEDGTGLGQIGPIRAIDATLAAGATQTLDLRTDNDPYGVALAYDELVALYIENASDGAGGTLQVKPGAANPFSSLLGAGSIVKLPKGARLFVFADPDLANVYVPTGADKTIDITESGGVNSAHIKIQLWGRR